MAINKEAQVINAFVSTDKPLPKILDEVGPLDTPHLSALGGLNAARRGKKELNQAVEEALAAPPDSDCPEFMAFFYTNLSGLLADSLRHDEALITIARAKVYLSARSDPIIKALQMVREGMLKRRFLHQGEQFVKIFDKALRMVPASRPRRKETQWQWALVLARMGYRNKIAKLLTQLYDQVSDTFTRSRVVLLDFISLVAAGQKDEAKLPLNELLRNRAQLMTRFHKFLFNRYLLLWQLQEHGPKAEVPTELLFDESHQASRTKTHIAWFFAARSLLGGCPQEALDHARQVPEYDQQYHLALCLAELACGHTAAAKRLFDLKVFAAEHIYDPFLEARIALLEGNAQHAQAAFGRFIDLARGQGAMGMADFMFRMSPELNTTGVLTLTGFAPPSGHAADPKTSKAPDTPDPQTDLLGQSPALVSVKQEIKRLSTLDLTVLIHGETGTGKELVARALHNQGPRKNEPFVALNCSAINENLLESELFGHEKGAFTGAQHAHPGVFAQAGKGTLFLDEIGDISPRLQASLLRVLESGEYRTVGGTQTRHMQCRVVAASHANLRQKAKDQTFREDLFFRLGRVELNLPALRDREDDVLLLAEHFLNLNRKEGKARLTDKLKQTLLNHPWPGNIRELKNEMERMRVMHSEKEIYEQSDVHSRISGEKQAPLADLEDTPGSSPHNLHMGKSQFHRRNRLRQLFDEHQRLTRVEVVNVLHIAKATATADLKALVEEGYVRKVMPKPAPRTHYFEKIDPNG